MNTPASRSRLQPSEHAAGAFASGVSATSVSTSSPDDVASYRADLSIVMPCFNEEAIVGYTIPRLMGAFEKAGYCLELVAVDNGSIDRTGEVIASCAAHYPSVVQHRVELNVGYGNGILSGLPLCTGKWVGMIPADGQVDAEDVVRLYEALITTDGRVLGKVRRRFRMDGLRRKVVSVFYNLLVRALWPNLDSIDINGSPKIMRREVINAMSLVSKGWFLDPEIMIKAHYMGLRVIEFNVFSRMRGNGVSHVRPATCWEFLRNLLRYRFSRTLFAWQQDVREFRPNFDLTPAFGGSVSLQGR